MVTTWLGKHAGWMEKGNDDNEKHENKLMCAYRNN